MKLSNITQCKRCKSNNLAIQKQLTIDNVETDGEMVVDATLKFANAELSIL